MDLGVKPLWLLETNGANFFPASSSLHLEFLGNSTGWVTFENGWKGVQRETFRMERTSFELYD